MKGRQGFASMSVEKRRAIASLGGRASQKKGVAHRWNSKTARAAALKGVDAREDRRAAERRAKNNAAVA